MNNDIDLGITAQGPQGKSAYEVAVENGFEGTEQQWLNSLKGNQGNAGSEGKSAYQLAVANGYAGTEQQWLSSLKGDPGNDGHTPKRGTDYWTDADKQSIYDETKQYVEDAILNGKW